MSPVAEYGKPGSRGPTQLGSGQTIDIINWTPYFRIKGDALGGVDFDEIVRVIVHHNALAGSVSGCGIKLYRVLGNYKELVANFRLLNAEAVVDIYGPLTSLYGTATQLDAVPGVTQDQIYVSVIARTEGR